MVSDAFKVGDHAHDGGDAAPVACDRCLHGDQIEAVLFDAALHLIEYVVAVDQALCAHGVHVGEHADGFVDGLLERGAHLEDAMGDGFQLCGVEIAHSVWFLLKNQPKRPVM